MNWLKKGLLSLSFLSASFCIPLKTQSGPMPAVHAATAAATAAANAAAAAHRRRVEEAQQVFMRLMRDPTTQTSDLYNRVMDCEYGHFDRRDVGYLNAARKEMGFDEKIISESQATELMATMHRMSRHDCFERAVRAIADPAKGEDDIVRALNGYSYDIGKVSFDGGDAGYIAEARKEMLTDALKPATRAEVFKLMESMSEKHSVHGWKVFGYTVGGLTAVIGAGAMISRRKNG